MSVKHYFPLSILLTGITLGLSACDSGTLVQGADEPVAAAALEQGTEEPVAAAIVQLPVNLPDNGGFESLIKRDNWSSCSSSGAFSIDATPGNGDSVLSVANGACLSQSIPAIAGATYTLSCEGRLVNSGGNSSITFGFVDASSAPVEVQEKRITTSEYAPITSTITAPVSAVSAEVLIFSDGEASVDNCRLTRLADGELLNGDFSMDLSGWQICDDTDGRVEVTDSIVEPGNRELSVSNGGCVYQYVDMSEILRDGPQIFNTFLSCDMQTDDSGFASITLAYRDANFQQVHRIVEDIVTGSTDGVFTSDLTSTVDARFAEVQVFSTSATTVDNCSLSF